MNKICSLAALLLFTCFAHASAQTVVPCPDKAGRLFSITAPADWKISPASSADDYITLEGPTGAVFYFRVVAGPVDKAMAAGQDSMKETYSDCKLSAQKF